jgi:hypothetical protein
VDFRAGLDGCEKPLPLQGIFFFIVLYSFRVIFVQLSVLSYHTACCGFFHYEKSDGFGRERTRDLGKGFDPRTVEPVASRYTD